MNKAEQKSIEWQKANHPMAIGGGNFVDVVDAYNVNPAFVAGYKEAEKDLALTWQDVRKLCSLSFIVEVDLGRDISDKQHYEEVLRRFNDQRGKK